MSIRWEGDVEPVSNTREIFLGSGFDTLPSRLNVDSRHITEGEKIGDGLWGPVHKAQWLGRKVAVKKFKNHTSQNVLVMANEVKPMLELRHPNVLKLLGFYLLAKEDLILQCSLIMELMDCDLQKYIQGIQNQSGHSEVISGSWARFLPEMFHFLLKSKLMEGSLFPGNTTNSLHHQGERKRELHMRTTDNLPVEGRGFPLSDDEGLYIITEIARGMNYMHERKYYHRDLKPGNVFIRKSGVSNFHVDVKIADFGTSGLMSDKKCDPKAGTTRYKAPEQLDPTAAALKDDKIDVFSFGVLCSFVLTGEEPYGDLVGRALVEHIRNGGKPVIPNRNLPDDVVGVIRGCLDTNPEARPNFPKIYGILESALQKVWKIHRPVATSASISSHPEELHADRVRRLMSIVGKLDLPKDPIYLNYVIPSEELQVLRKIGKGVEGQVYLVDWKGTQYAQKKWHYSPPLSPWFKMLPNLIHKNIVSFMGYSLSSDGLETSIMRPSIIMEFLAIDLAHLIEDRKRLRAGPSFSEMESRYIMKEIAEGMAYLHGKGIVHGDLKPQNVVVSEDQDTGDIVVKLIDYLGEFGGFTAVYGAPERLRHRMDKSTIITDYKKTDVYSFAITCCEVLHRGMDFQSEHYWSPRKFVKAVMRGWRPLLPNDTSQGLKDLLERCWHRDPSCRPDFSEICDFFETNG